MCFSAPVSFIASACLGVIGVASVARAPKKKKLIAVIPVIFAIQQFIEGLQWVSLGGGQGSIILGYAFLFFAFLLWPMFIPIALWFLHRKSKNKNTVSLLKFMVVLGVFVSLYSLWVLIEYPLSIEILNNSINYVVNVPFFSIAGLVYLFVVSAPFLISKDNFLRLLGLLFISSAIISYVWFISTFNSTWCFFAAVLSGLIYIYSRQKPT